MCRSAKQSGNTAEFLLAILLYLLTVQLIGASMKILLSEIWDSLFNCDITTSIYSAHH